MGVGIVVVSHSRALAEAAVELADIMVQDSRPKVAIAAGLSDGRFGTDATEIMSAVESVNGPEGVVLFVDMGSAVMNAEAALELLGVSSEKIRILAAPFVEGITAGMVRAAMGGSVDAVAAAAEGVLDAKLVALGRTSLASSDAPAEDQESVEAEVVLVNEVGLHARPATRLAQLASKFDGELDVYFEDDDPADGMSAMSLMALGARKGSRLKLVASGTEAQQLLDAVVEFISSGMGD
ncbi:dihydroxyacetone kinase phosphoryl donor subunit DhaM [Tessaracoccus sp. OH4464_COT-324]|uniref:dihydroxyacetone kinase phosphoryl donor subunit DhaM n=1 Tax=Tessaracoccus sp. OH4464_COT-324 TaxID=2491059 RepID=UPI000F632C1F|nr:dihydroxyacetone kinase phosphoryl donor subunit DhaM [Tessaracoccus sp. OH4464_COT-324]RRD46422.1 HPr family phosphocarrier protein [Tessaracoccus sp. OH4464_COT-324]